MRKREGDRNRLLKDRDIEQYCCIKTKVSIWGECYSVIGVTPELVCDFVAGDKFFLINVGFFSCVVHVQLHLVCDCS